MYNSSRLDVSVSENNSCHVEFHKNMVLLMQFNNPSPALTGCFKEGMFAYPNKDGFLHVSHFLLKIIYPDTKAFRDCWPVLEKSQEKDFRNTVCEMMRGFNKDFADIILFPEVGPSKLITPGGKRFVLLMWNLSLLAIAVQAKRDLGCHLLQKPGNVAPDIIACATNLQNLIMTNNLEEIGKMESSLESFLKEFRETRLSILSGIHDLKARIKDAESKINLDEYDLDLSLKQKLSDLNSEEGISILKEKISQAEELWEEHYRSLKNSGIIVRDWKRVTEAVVNQEVNGHKFVLDGNFLRGQGSSDILTSKYFRAYADISEGDSQVSLLDHLSIPCEKLKSLNLVFDKTDSQLHLDDWERVFKERQGIESEMSKLDAELDRKVLELSAYCNRERNLSAEDQHSIDSTSLSSSIAVCSSTPIKNKTIPLICKLANISPFQQQSSNDYFGKTFQELLAKRVLSSSPISVQTRIDPLRFSNASSLDDLIERFQQVQLKMKQDKQNK